MCSSHTTCCTCCQPSDCTPVATTSTTTTTTTLCPDPLPCDTVYLTDCIVYSGCDDDCLQVYTGDTLTQVLANIFEAYEECYGPIETTTTSGPPVPTEICLGYSELGCAQACASECSTYYTSLQCYNAIIAGDGFTVLDCSIYTDIAMTIPAPFGFYSHAGATPSGSTCMNISQIIGEFNSFTPCP